MNDKSISSLRAVVVSNIVSLGDVVFSFVVALFTGSTVMLAQGFQGLADLITTLFLLLGVKRSSRKASKTHPFGYGREMFFWVLISSLFAFVVSGGVAIYLAIDQIIEPSPIDSIATAFIALTLGLTTNGYSLKTSLKRLAQNAKGKNILGYVRQSSLVETKMTILVDFLGTLSAFFGIIALVLYQVTDKAIFDGIGALVIGLLISLGALLVIIDLHDLIVGRSPSGDVIENIRKSAMKPKGVNEVLDLQATSVGSGRLLVLLKIHFADNLTTDDIELITDKIEQAVVKAEPQVSRIQIEAETPSIKSKL